MVRTHRPSVHGIVIFPRQESWGGGVVFLKEPLTAKDCMDKTYPSPSLSSLEPCAAEVLNPATPQGCKGKTVRFPSPCLGLEASQDRPPDILERKANRKLSKNRNCLCSYLLTLVRKQVSGSEELVFWNRGLLQKG